MKDKLSESQENILASLKPKKRKNSRAKGNAFENKIAKQLNERFNTTDFSRTPGSGAFATTHKLPKHLQLHGDLITPQGFAFIVECKKGYNNLGFDSLLNEKSKLWEWLDTLDRDTAAAEKPGFLLMAQDRRATMVITYRNKKLEETITKHILIKNKHREYIMLTLEEFLSMPDSWFNIS